LPCNEAFIQSETCGLTIPDIELVLHAGTLGGRFTTLEGILFQVYDELSDKVFAAGDSVGSANPDGPDIQQRNKFETFLESLKAVRGYVNWGCNADGVVLDKKCRASLHLDP